MTSEETLAREAQARNRQMAIAVAAGVLLMVASILGLTGPHAKVNESTLGLITEHQRGALDIVSAVVNALGEIALASTLVFLFRSARARLESTQRFVPWLAVLGAALTVVCGVVNAVVIQMKASDFVSHGQQTYDQAYHLTSGSGLLLLQIGTQLGSLIIAIAFILVSLQAMRAGLLPRFLGYVGMFAGVLVLFPIIVVPVVELYFLLAVAALIFGRWPSGLPAAWRTGRAEAWPSSAEMRARRLAEAEEQRGQRGQRTRRGGRRTAAGSDTIAGDDNQTTTVINGGDGDGDDATPARARSSTRKRKRKRRH